MFNNRTESKKEIQSSKTIIYIVPGFILIGASIIGFAIHFLSWHNDPEIIIILSILGLVN